MGSLFDFFFWVALPLPPVAVVYAVRGTGRAGLVLRLAGEAELRGTVALARVRTTRLNGWLGK